MEARWQSDSLKGVNERWKQDAEDEAQLESGSKSAGQQAGKKRVKLKRTHGGLRLKGKCRDRRCGRYRDGSG